jgi:hypothetical protein
MQTCKLKPISLRNGTFVAVYKNICVSDSFEISAWISQEILKENDIKKDDKEVEITTQISYSMVSQFFRDFCM